MKLKGKVVELLWDMHCEHDQSSVNVVCDQGHLHV